MQYVIITGANSGLGLATAKHLLKKGYGVVLACRDDAKASVAKDQLQQQTDSKNITALHLDLASMLNIKNFVGQLQIPPYALICNAGIQYSSPTKYTADNFELTFGVNMLGHFLLTNLLLAKYPGLERIAVVSSAAHDPKTGGPFRPPAFTAPVLMAHPQDEPQTDWYKLGNQRYVTSKLCLLFFTYKLNALLQLNGRGHVMVNAFNPGLMPATGLGRNSPPFTRFMWYHILPLIAKFFKGGSTPERSGALLAELVSAPKNTGKYYDLDHEASSSPESYDENKMNLLWQGCEALTGLKTSEKWYDTKTV